MEIAEIIGTSRHRILRDGYGVTTLGGIIDFADENEVNQSSRISDEDSYNPDLNDDVYLF